MGLNACVARVTNFKNFTNYDLLVLIQDFELAEQFNLKTSEFSVLAVLARCYNNKTGVMFPGIETIARRINASTSTVKRCISELRLKGLIIIEKNKKHNIYKFTDRFFNAVQPESAQVSNRTAESVKLTPKHNKEHNKFKNISSYKQKPYKPPNDDLNKISFSFNSEDKKRYDEIFQTLKNWSFTGAHFVIRKHGLKRIEEAISLIKKKKPKNKGGYLRTLLNLEVSNKKSFNDVKKAECVNYKSAEQTKQEMEQNKPKTDCKSPWNDKKTAIDHIKSFSEELKKEPIIAKKIDKLKELWELNGCFD